MGRGWTATKLVREGEGAAAALRPLEEASGDRRWRTCVHFRCWQHHEAIQEDNRQAVQFSEAAAADYELLGHCYLCMSSECDKRQTTLRQR